MSYLTMTGNEAEYTFFERHVKLEDIGCIAVVVVEETHGVIG